MLTLVAIETSTTLASVALLRNGEMRSRESQGVQTHSQVILPMIQALLDEAGIQLAQCDAVAFGAGPGSFTGVRTACGVAQGLGFGADLPLIPVITLEAMAEACRQRSASGDVLPVLDAAMGEVYWAQYRFENGWHPVLAPRLSLPEWVRPQTPVCACGNGLQNYAAAFAKKDFMSQAMTDIVPHAQYVAALGAQAFQAGKTVPPQDAQPYYLRNKVAYTTAEREERAKACG